MPRSVSQPARSAMTWLGPAVVAATGIGLCVWMWGRTGDILGDFGHEVYVAWQMSRGQLLYRDIAYQYGALSPSINAHWMKALGPGIDSIRIANLVVLIAATALLYRRLRVASDSFSAMLASCFFLVVFAFGCATRITNYNFLTPYAHGLTHGFVLCLGTIECVALFARQGRPGYALAGGILCGLAFLTKPEIFLGAAATLWLGLAGALWIGSAKRTGMTIGMAMIGMIGVPLIAFAFLAADVSWDQAWGGVVGGWQFIGKSYVTSTQFNRESLGILDVGASLRAIGQCAAIEAAALGALACAALAMRGKRGVDMAVGIVAGAVLCALVIRTWRTDYAFWIDADRPLILFAVGAVLATGWRVLKWRPGVYDAQRTLAQWSLAVLSLALLARMVLNVRTYHLGFVLAAPCAVMAVAALVGWLPAAVDRAGGGGVVVRLGIIGMVAGLMVNRLVLANQLLAERTLTIPVAEGGSLRARAVDTPALQAVRWLAATPANFAAAGWPDGAGIIYAAGRRNSVPYDEMEQMILRMWGERAVLRACQMRPPDAFLLIRVDISDAGGRYFGQDYGPEIFHWIEANYRHVLTFGQQDASRSIDVWLRK